MTKLPRHSRSRAILVGTTGSIDARIPATPLAAGALAEMRAVLTDPALCGWPENSVTIFQDASEDKDLRLALRRLAREAKEALLFYFAGSGILASRRELCLGLATTRFDHAEDTSLRYAQVRRELEESRARLKIVILDCSYSGRVIASLPGAQIAEPAGIDGMYVLTACDREAGAASPGDGAIATPFTAGLTAIIRAGIPRGPATLSLEDLYPLLSARLKQAGQPAPNCEGTGQAGRVPFTRNSQAEPPRQSPPSRRRFIAVTGSAVAAAATGVAITVRELPGKAGGEPRATGTANPSGTAANLPASADQVALIGPSDNVNRIAFTPDSRFLIGGTGGNISNPQASLWLWDVTRQDKPGVPLEHGPTVHGVAFHPKVMRFATASNGGVVRLWDLDAATSSATALPVPVYKHDDTAWEVAFSPDGTILASSGSDGSNKRVVLCDLSTRSPPVALPHPYNASGLAFSLNGDFLVTGCNDGRVRLWDLVPLRHAAPGQPDPQPRDVRAGHKAGNPIPQVAFQPYGKGTFATASWDSTVLLWNLTSHKPLAKLGEGIFRGSVTGVAFSPDGKTLAAASADNVYLWDVRTRRLKRPLNSRTTFAATYDRKGKLLATTTGDGIYLWMM